MPKRFGETILQTGRNFNICKARVSTRKNQEEDVAELEIYHGIKLPKDAKKQRLLLRNCVYPKLGLHILEEAFREYKILI